MILTLDSRLEKLEKEREQVVASLNAYNGAIQVLRELIAERDKPETEQ